jgi:tetratricopeptide (TPR) repeat protein
MGKNLFCRILLFLTAVFCFGQDNFLRGEELFMQNKPREALVFLENCVAQDPAHVQAFLYMGIAYEQMERTDEAIAAYRKILPRAGALSATISTNLANAYFRKENSELAELFYTQALEADTSYSAAYLGRANTRVKAGAIKDAVGDYELYLDLEPRSPKRPEIERMITFIREGIATAERQKLLAEETARAETERRQRFLDELAASLQSVADESAGLSTGAENVEAYNGEFELE